MRRKMQEKGWCGMAIGFYFTNGGFTPEKYDETIKQLAAAGAGAPEGRSFHAALEVNGEVHVFDIWESHDTFQEFGHTLVPILEGLDVKVNEPMVAQVHNVIQG
jgi:hypothetical protein